MSSAFTLSIPGFTIACEAWGDNTLPPMLALHGWLDNVMSFAPLADYLKAHFYIVAIDLPGHGLSSHLALGGHYHFIDGIFSIINVINALGFDKVHLMGHSMGACLASLVAGVIPERILSLILIEGLGPFSSPEDTCCNQLTHYARYTELVKNKQAKPYPSFELAAKARTKNGHLSFCHAEMLCKRGVIEKDNLFYWRHDRRLITSSPLQMTEPQILSCLEAITTKTYFIRASQGFIFHEDVIQKRIKAIKQINVTEIQGGHHVHMEQPDALRKHLVDVINTRA